MAPNGNVGTSPNFRHTMTHPTIIVSGIYIYINIIIIMIIIIIIVIVIIMIIVIIIIVIITIRNQTWLAEKSTNINHVV